MSTKYQAAAGPAQAWPKPGAKPGAAYGPARDRAAQGLAGYLSWISWIYLGYLYKFFGRVASLSSVSLQCSLIVQGVVFGMLTEMCDES